MLKDGFLRFCDDPEVACCRAEHELAQLRREITRLKAENAELRMRCEVLMSDLKGDCASCAKNGVDSDVCVKCVESEIFDEYEWRGSKGETGAND